MCPASLCKEEKIQLRRISKSYLRTGTCCSPGSGEGESHQGLMSCFIGVSFKSHGAGITVSADESQFQGLQSPEATIKHKNAI